MLRCRNENGESRIERAGPHCIRLAGPQSRGVKSVRSSGRQSPRGFRVKMPLCHVACPRPSEFVGFDREAVWRRWLGAPVRPLSILCGAEEIAILRAQGAGVRDIARRLGQSSVDHLTRAASQCSDAKRRFRVPRIHCAMAQRSACQTPKKAKLAVNDRLRNYVQQRLQARS